MSGNKFSDALSAVEAIGKHCDVTFGRTESGLRMVQSGVIVGFQVGPDKVIKLQVAHCSGDSWSLVLIDDATDVEDCPWCDDCGERKMRGDVLTYEGDVEIKLP